MKKWTAGFTLIELLIVVAIIAILAAIAVPNFLEAQVRSKVARAKSDERSLATAIEAYTVDNNKPPIGQNECNWYANSNQAWGSASVNDWVWMHLTTPMAYMTSIPLDPFALNGKITSSKGTGVSFLNDKNYIYLANYDHVLDHTAPAGLVSSEAVLTQLNINWVMYSFGPSRSNRLAPLGNDPILGLSPLHPSNSTQTLYPDMFYDPSNGTATYGYLYRSNRGIEPTAGGGK